jgi:hypothetical protein
VAASGTLARCQGNTALGPGLGLPFWSKRRLGIFVVHVGVLSAGRFQVLYASEQAASNSLVGEFGEPPLHQIDPGTIRGSEVDMKRAFREPFPDDGGFVRSVVVQDEMHIQSGGHLRLDLKTVKLRESRGSRGPFRALVLVFPTVRRQTLAGVGQANEIARSQRKLPQVVPR